MLDLPDPHGPRPAPRLHPGEELPERTLRRGLRDFRGIDHSRTAGFLGPRLRQPGPASLGCRQRGLPLLQGGGPPLGYYSRPSSSVGTTFTGLSPEACGSSSNGMRSAQALGLKSQVPGSGRSPGWVQTDSGEDGPATPEGHPGEVKEDGPASFDTGPRTENSETLSSRGTACTAGGSARVS